MRLWLDDYRVPNYFAYDYWAKNYDQAIAMFKEGKVTFCSLDHDLSEEDIMKTENFKEKTGYDVLCWIEENDKWPVDGIRIHTMNPVGRLKMESVVYKHYGRLFYQ